MAHSHTIRTYEKLRQEILTGERAPAARLKVEDLKQALDVGASPIREALSLLTSDRLVERLDQRGFRVSTISRAHFVEVLELRCMLEARALAASVEAGGATWRAQVAECHEALKTGLSEDANDAEQRHKAFHMSLLAGAEMPVLQSICDQLYDQNVRYRFLAGKNPGYASRDVRDEHGEIFEAAMKGEADYAVSLLQVHYRRTGHYVASLLTDM